MKYIITENKLHDIMNQYLDSFLESNYVNRLDSFIIVSEKIFDWDGESWTDYMEFDNHDGRLWINAKFLRNFEELFGRGRDESIKVITKWFEDKFGVVSEYQES